jgi:hypothetical protein
LERTEAAARSFGESSAAAAAAAARAPAAAARATARGATTNALNPSGLTVLRLCAAIAVVVSSK